MAIIRCFVVRELAARYPADPGVVELEPITPAQVALIQAAKWWLVLSSTWFVVPGVAALFRRPCRWWFTLVFVGAALVSVNYWRDPVPGPRRNADLYTAKAAFLFTLVAGSAALPPAAARPALLVAACAAGLYRLSCHLTQAGSPLWFLAHMAFHAVVTAGQLLVVWGGTVVAS